MAPTGGTRHDLGVEGCHTLDKMRVACASITGRRECGRLIQHPGRAPGRRELPAHANSAPQPSQHAPLPRGLASPLGWARQRHARPRCEAPGAQSRGGRPVGPPEAMRRVAGGSGLNQTSSSRCVGTAEGGPTSETRPLRTVKSSPRAVSSAQSSLSMLAPG